MGIRSFDKIKTNTENYAEIGVNYGYLRQCQAFSLRHRSKLPDYDFRNYTDEILRGYNYKFPFNERDPKKDTFIQGYGYVKKVPPASPGEKPEYIMLPILP